MLKHPNLPSGGQVLKIWTNGFWFLVTRQSLVTRSDPTLFYFAIIFPGEKKRDSGLHPLKTFGV
jgi:hypothetical protein